MNSKRTIDLQEKAPGAQPSHQRRHPYHWQHVNEKVNGNKRRGGSADLCDDDRVGRNLFNVQFNLMFDYRCDRSWGVAHVEFKNQMGIRENHQKGCDVQPLVLAENGDNTAIGDDASDCIQRANSYMFGSGEKNGLSLRKAYWGYNICADGTSRFDIETGRRRLYDVFDSRIQFNAQFDGILLRYASQFDCADLFNRRRFHCGRAR